jgi:hypothetical protein
MGRTSTQSSSETAMGPWNMHHDDEHYSYSGDEWRLTGPAVAPFPVSDVLELGKRRAGVFALRSANLKLPGPPVTRLSISAYARGTAAARVRK